MGKATKKKTPSTFRKTILLLKEEEIQFKFAPIGSVKMSTGLKKP